MSILLSGQGFAPPMSYFIIFGCLWLSFMARRSAVVSLALATGITAVVYFVPCVAMVGVVMIFGYAVSQMQSLEVDTGRGRVTFEHGFFRDAQSAAMHNGFDYTEGASSWGIAPNDRRIPDAMRQAARRAVRIDPYRTHDGVVVRTTVEMERGKAVIYDHIVTREQIERHAAGGLWNLPSGAVKHNGKELPTMDSLSAAFVDKFNGPDTTKVRRK